MRKISKLPRWKPLLSKPKMPKGVQSLLGAPVEISAEERASQNIEGTLAQRIIHKELKRRDLQFDYMVATEQGLIVNFILPKDSLVIQVPDAEPVDTIRGYADIGAYIYAKKEGNSYAEIMTWEAEGDPISLEATLNDLVGR